MNIFACLIDYESCCDAFCLALMCVMAVRLSQYLKSESPHNQIKIIYFHQEALDIVLYDIDMIVH